MSGEEKITNVVTHPKVGVVTIKTKTRETPYTLVKLNCLGSCSVTGEHGNRQYVDQKQLLGLLQHRWYM